MQDRLPMRPARTRKLLLIASTGGHLAQLVKLSSRLGAAEDSLWITFDSEQSRSLLRGKRVFHVPYIAPRDWRSLLRAARLIDQRLAEEVFDAAISTGAGLALAGLPLARKRGISVNYIESVSRVLGPSLTGRLIYKSGIANMFTQHAGWAHGRWNPISPVLAEYEATQAESSVEKPKIFVTLGTIRPYRFDALIDAMLATGMCDGRTVWQLGTTDREKLPGTQVEYMTAGEFEATALESDVVVTHAGVGTVMDLLNMGKAPVVVPRRSSEAEHVDDHQAQITSLLSQLRLAVPVEVKELSREHIELSMRSSTVPAYAEVQVSS